MSGRGAADSMSNPGMGGMMESQQKRPGVVTVLGWVFIFLAGLMMLSSGMGFMLLNVMQEKSQDLLPMGEETGWPFDIARLISKHGYALLCLNLAAAVFVLLASIEFLSLRAWARSALEVSPGWGLSIPSVYASWPL